jgi:hypothetical protein
MRKNYVLIDYENVQPDLMAVLNEEHFTVLVFVGSSQSKVTFEVASSLQKMGDRAEYVKISGNGSNALDFHIAYYIGKISSQEPDAFFHIISKDTGFDPLIQYLKSKKILACRSKTIAEMPIIKITHSKSPSERATAVIEKLSQNGSSKPRTIKTLSSTINAFFQKSLSEQDISLVIEHLIKQNAIVIADNKVTYVQ